jgi:hypothetical protein
MITMRQVIDTGDIGVVGCIFVLLRELSNGLRHGPVGSIHKTCGKWQKQI